MTADTSSAALHRGARVRLSGGKAELVPAAAVPDGALPARFSVLSPGTEYRHMSESASGPAREAGYMCLGRHNARDEWVLAPVPHGSSFAPDHPGAVTTPLDIPLEVSALARFQQIAVLGLDRLPASADLDSVVVVGSGPVAVGCALELRRRGARDIQVCTSRPKAPIGRVPGVRITPEMERSGAYLVIDTAGRPERAFPLLAPDGVLGMLGTPEPPSTFSALTAHRNGWTVIGMHELAGLVSDCYRDAYTTAVAWLANEMIPHPAASWCRVVPGSCAPRVFASLRVPERRLPEPVIIFDWGSND